MADRGYGPDKRLVYYEDERWHEAVKELARQQQINVCELLRRIVRAGVNAHIELDNAANDGRGSAHLGG